MTWLTMRSDKDLPTVVCIVFQLLQETIGEFRRKIIVSCNLAKNYNHKKYS